ncbi:acyltransferase [Brucella sp. B13-0095]|uniref:acyltransferase family protein n=1 Tax=Brucella sp. B13-0095 TaxID=1867845 RepID=UPI00114C8B6F|nr:acyltransferase [Brucella sp. B13-0095]
MTINSSQNIAYIGRMDHLRFYAAALVVIYHGFVESMGHFGETSSNPIKGIFMQGHTGVGLFLVLSGFLFGSIGDGKNIHYGKYIFNRVVRIYPLYIFAIILAVSMNYNSYSSVQTLLLSLPIFSLSELSKLPMFGQLWTIAVEFQFYMIFPFIMMAINMKGIRYAFLMLGLTVFLKLWIFVLNGTVREISYMTLIGRIDQFLVGMIIAHFMTRNKNAVSNPVHLFLSSMAVLSTMLAFNKAGGYFGTPHLSFWVIWPTIEALMWGYFACAYMRCSLNIASVIDEKLRFLGETSYSIYIMHMVAISFVYKIIPRLNLTGIEKTDALVTSVFIAFPASILLACATFYLIERPFFHFKMKYTAPIKNSAPVT